MAGKRKILLFDGVCNFCSGGVLFSVKRLADPDLRFCPMQSPAGQRLLKQHGFPLNDYRTFIFLENAKTYTKSAAAIRLSQFLKAPWPSVGKAAGLVPRAFRDWLYDRIAKHRYRVLGKKDECMVPAPEIRGKFILE